MAEKRYRSLQDFENVKINLKICKKNHIVALHKVIFEKEGDRKNRQRLRSFPGFSFEEGDKDYEQKIEYIKNNLCQADLMAICILLGLRYDEVDPEAYILRNLLTQSLLQDANNDEEEDDDGDVDEDEDEIDDEDGSVDLTMVNRYNDEEIPEESRNESVRRLNKTQSNNYYEMTQEDDNERYRGCNRESNRNKCSQQPRFALNFRDIEDSIRPFDGKDGIAIKDWIQEFEETAAMLYWDELQMLVFAKKSLRGLAKQFVAGERGLSSWPKLKNALLDEFKLRINSRQVHRKLNERTMQKGETVMEYLYIMKEIAAEGNVGEEDLILYIIDGIKDLNTNKQILYGARNLRQFKEKVRDYEEHNTRRTDESKRKPEIKSWSYERRNLETKPLSAIKKDVNSALKCYNCGESGHKSADCANKKRGTKCFKCNNFGHLARECKSQKDNVQHKEVRCLKPERDGMLKEVIIGDRTWTALIDTGSQLNVMRDVVYRHLKLPKMSAANIQLVGFGRAVERMKPIGSITVTTNIDDEDYDLLFHVVPGDYLKDDLIIGSPICKQAEITANPMGVNIKKWEIARMMNITVHKEDDLEYDIEETASKDAKKIVQSIVGSYKPEKTKSTNVTMKIVLVDETPIATRPRRLPLSERQLVEDQIEEWLKEGIIECSESEFSSPIVLVTKKDGKKRLCVDYRRINKVIVRDRFPLPLIEDQLDRLQNAIVFSTLDLKNGFFHVEVEKESRKYTSFVTHNGQYQFRKVPFGLANSPAVFQRFINTIFRGLTRRGIAMPYVDDVIIAANDENEAVAYLKEVLGLAKDYGLNLNLKKCHFLKRRIEFLGHIIENHRLSPSPAKMEAVMRFPVPKTLKQVESFLGLAGYFRKFIPGFSKEAKALSDLTKNDSKFIMGIEQLRSFEALKLRLCGNPVLKIFNQRHETELHTDASADGYGAVLLQREPEDGQLHPVYFMSKKTSDLERKYTSYELEILAVVSALNKFRVYLLGMKFKIVTDCNAFAKTMAKKDLSTRVARWLLLLQEYDYVIEHRSGTQMRHVDALSRCAVMTVIIEGAVMAIREEGILEKIARAQANDETLKVIFEILQQKDVYDGFYIKSRILYKCLNEKELLVVPKNLQFEIIQKAHEKGHFAIKKTKDLLKDDYYIPKMKEKIQRVIDNCIQCLLVNRKRGRQEGHLHPIAKHDLPLRTYHIDHLGPLESTSKMYKYIFVVVDAFSKFCWLYPTKSTTTREVITKLQQQSTIFGNPEVIISDRGTAFTSEEFQTYCRVENIQHHAITTGLPRANGQVERLNSTITSVLAKLSVDQPDKWFKWVHRVQQVINSTHHRSIGTTPFELLIGRPMRTNDDARIKELVEEEIRAEYDEFREDLRKMAKQNIERMQEENSKAFNRKRRPALKYNIGEYIAIKRTQFGGGLKMKTKYLGPYQVTAAKPNDTYNVVRVGGAEGPKITTTCAEFMKKWPTDNPREALE